MVQVLKLVSSVLMIQQVNLHLSQMLQTTQKYSQEVFGDVAFGGIAGTGLALSGAITSYDGSA